MSEASQTISAQDVKALRDRTGAGMMDCKRALTESYGDVEKAIDWLRVKQGKRIRDRGERAASEGTVQSYVHANARIGVLVEVDCETDFVARNEEFIAFARELALHVAAAAPRFVSEEQVDPQARERELSVFQRESADKPEAVREKIAEGKLRKWMEEVVLLNQAHVNADKHDGKTIAELRDEIAAKTGENVIVRRFTRFAVGD